jgi:DNA ligase-1
MKLVMGTLRLGIADFTVMDALAIAFTGLKSNRSVLEKAYNVTSDLGAIAKTLATHGLDSNLCAPCLLSAWLPSRRPLRE